VTLQDASGDPRSRASTTVEPPLSVSTDGVSVDGSSAAAAPGFRRGLRRKRAEASPEHLREVAALVERAQLGDREAFALLYDRYVDNVYRYVYFRTFSHSLAEDLTSETFLRALRRLPTFSWQGTDIGAWFLTIARNLTLDHAKSSATRLENLTADVTEMDRPDEGTEAVVLRDLSADALLAAVKNLKAEQRECVTLRFLQGMSVAETASLMSRTEGAVKQLQLRAMRQLAGQLQDLREDGPDGT
jgi:RNA polymerase sigma-70 factor (ECF subfamily)